MNHWVMDYETLKNCFVAVFKHYKTEEIHVFKICTLQDDFGDFIEFLQKNVREKNWHISFNGLSFDGQITNHILHNYIGWEEGGRKFAANIYQYAQDVIARSNRKEWQEYPEWKMLIPQIDVFKLNHWDNPAKRSSLKWIEYTMDWDNILDMPINHETEITTQEELNMIVEYCINDVDATKEIYNRSKNLIALRMNLTNEYNINLFNASEPRISKELFSHYLSKELKISKKELKSLRTYRETIKLENIILPYINFNTLEFNTLLKRFKTVELDPANIKGAFKHDLNYKNVKTHFGLGGAHGANKPGVYTSNEENVIMSSDIVSFYPMLAIKNGWSPAHLPKKEFCKLYEWFFNERKKIPKSNSMNYVYKIILNSTYGLSNDKNSFLYDPEFTMRVTINGQLTLMILYEMIMEAIPEAIPLLQNTDGIETVIPKSKIDLYHKICKEWCGITDFSLEHDQYQKIILADVNNYIGIFNFVETDITKWREIKKANPHYIFRVKNGVFEYAPVKCKGRFEFTNLALHKNKSKLVIPKGIFQYFVHDVLPEDYLATNNNILDYCIGSKTNGGWQMVAKRIKDSEIEEENLQKINRYYVSNQGVKIIKKNKNDGRLIQLEAGPWIQTVYNKIELESKWKDYDINMKYYLQAIEKEINNILGVATNQLKLFN